MEKTNYTQEINMTESLMNRINELISHYPEGKQKSALLPVLHEVQDAHDNWLSIELQNKVAEILEILPIEVYEVVTFYTMYNQRPIGKYMFEFCQTSPCCQNGVEDLMVEICWPCCWLWLRHSLGQTWCLSMCWAICCTSIGFCCLLLR